MTAPVVTLYPEELVADAARRLHAWKLDQLPVVDRAGLLVGIVSRSDVLKVFLRSDEEIRCPTGAGRARIRRVLAQGVAAAIDWALIGGVVSLSIGYHGQLAPPHSTVKVVAYYTLAVAVVWLYFAALEACALRATLGKLAVGVRVTTLDGQRIGVGRASARLLAKLLSLAPLGLGFVLAGVDARRQALHDKVAGTLVVRG